MPPTTRKPRPGTAPKRSTVSTAEPEPIVLGQQSQGPIERVTIFTLDDREYGVPRNLPAGVLLSAMEMMTDGEELDARGVRSLLETTLGEDGYKALKDPRVSVADFGRVVAAVTHQVGLQAEEMGKASG